MDRFLVSVDWEDHFQTPFCLEDLPRLIFNHLPIICLVMGSLLSGPRLFEVMWLMHPDFTELVKSW